MIGFKLSSNDDVLSLFLKFVNLHYFTLKRTQNLFIDEMLKTMKMIKIILKNNIIIPYHHYNLQCYGTKLITQIDSITFIFYKKYKNG